MDEKCGCISLWGRVASLGGMIAGKRGWMKEGVVLSCVGFWWDGCWWKWMDEGCVDGGGICGWLGRFVGPVVGLDG
jgi:hypothetical protein